MVFTRPVATQSTCASPPSRRARSAAQTSAVARSKPRKVGDDARGERQPDTVVTQPDVLARRALHRRPAAFSTQALAVAPARNSRCCACSADPATTTALIVAGADRRDGCALHVAGFHWPGSRYAGWDLTLIGYRVSPKLATDPAMLVVFSRWASRLQHWQRGSCARNCARANAQALKAMTRSTRCALDRRYQVRNDRAWRGGDCRAPTRPLAGYLAIAPLSLAR